MGCGAVGSVVAASLSRGGRDVSVVDPWFQHVEAIKAHGLTIKCLDEEFTASPTAFHLSELDNLGNFDLLIIAAKSYDTNWMTLLAKDHMTAEASALSLQNGMNDERVAKIVGATRVYGAVVTMTAELLGPGVARRTSDANQGTLILGNLGWGADPAQIAELASELSALDAVLTVDDIWPERWGKLTLNVMSNALSGITGLTTKRLWSDDTALDVLIALGREAALVATACGIELAPVLRSIPHDAWLSAVDTGCEAWCGIRTTMKHLAAGRSGAKENLPSLLQDIRKGRRTEVDFLNGWIAEQGRRVGVQTPANVATIGALRPIELGLAASNRANITDLAEFVRSSYAVPGVVDPRRRPGSSASVP